MPTISAKDFPNAGAYTAFGGSDGLYGISISADEPRLYDLDELALFVLGGKAIGGAAAGDIVTTNAAQTLTNKSLTAPVLNGSAIPSATGAEVQHCAGVTSAIQTQLNSKAPLASPTFTGTVVLPSTTSIGNVSATEIGHLGGVTSPIQAQINAITSAQSDTANTKTYALSFTTGAGETYKDFTQATLLSLSLPETFYAINPASIIAAAYVHDGGKIQFMNLAVSGGEGSLDITTKVVNGLTQVDFIRLGGLTAATTYSFTVHFKILQQIGA